MVDDQRTCKLCGAKMRIDIGGFNNYARRGICDNCHTHKKTKVCTSCKEEKPVEEFFVDSGWRKRANKCTVCTKEYNKQMRAKAPKKPRVRKVEKTDADLFDMMNKRW